MLHGKLDLNRAESAEFRRFSKLAHPLQYAPHRRIGAENTKGDYDMHNLGYYMKHALAGAAAVLISGLLFVNSLAVSAHEVNSIVGILA